MRFEIRHVNHVESRYFWRAVTDLGRILAWSENYPTKADCEEALNLLRQEAETAPVIDAVGAEEGEARPDDDR